MNDDGASGLHAVIHPDGSATLTVDETPERIDTTAAEDARREVVERAARIAELVGHAVPLVVDEPDGTWPLLIHADGRIETDEGRTDIDPVDDPTDAAGTDDETDDPADTDTDTDAGDTDAPEAADSAWAPPASDADAVAAAWAPRTSSVIADVPAAHEPSPADALDEATVVVDRRTPAAEAPETEAPDAGVAGAPEIDAADDAASVTEPGTAPEADTDTRDIPTRVPADAHDANAADAHVDDPPPSRHASRHGARPSFLTAERAEEPATQGWRRGLVALGLRVPPGGAERREREDIAAVSRLWSEPRTIAVVNGKGGSGKTPTAILLSAVFARRGGAGVLAWDNNQTRGTLGWRTERSEHDATLHDLLPETARLLTSEAQSADLARFVHHQARDRFDVLRSQPIALAEEQRMDAADVSRIHAVAAKYYRLIIMDSGNDESDPMWLRMIDHTDQLVVATTTRGEHAEAGALLLEALAKRDERTAALAHGAVTIVSQADPNASTDEVSRVVDGFRGIARDVATIPYDPAMIGGALRFDNLRPATQRAWLGAGATIARGL